MAGVIMLALGKGIFYELGYGLLWERRGSVVEVAGCDAEEAEIVGVQRSGALIE